MMSLAWRSGGAILLFATFAVVLMLVPSGASAATMTIQPYEDVLFTDVSTVNGVERFGEDGYLAATRGGLVAWDGEGDRSVFTRMDGLPSNLVWNVDHQGPRVFVGTEFGAASVDLTTGEVEPIEIPGVPQDSARAAVVDVAVEDQTVYLLHRTQGLATRALDGGEWNLQDLAGDRSRALDLEIEDGTAWVGHKSGNVYALTEDGSWDHRIAASSAPSQLAILDGTVFVGTQEDGLEAYTTQGDTANVTVPASLKTGPVRTVVDAAGDLWIPMPSTLHVYRQADGHWIDNDGLPRAEIRDLELLPAGSASAPAERVLLGTSFGVTTPKPGNGTGDWVLHTTLHGPPTNIFLGQTIHEDKIWIGDEKGASIFDPSRNYWQHIGSQQGLVAQPVHRVEHGPERTWFAAEGAVFGLSEDPKEWLVLKDENPSKRPGNLFYDLEPEGETLWMPELGNGLLEHNVPANETKRYEIPSGLLSHGLTCTERWHEFLAVCSVEAFQLFNLTQRNPAQPLGPPHDFCTGSACDGNYPANNTFMALADGPRMWTATVDAGVVLLERHENTGVSVEDSWQTDDGLPSNQVRALAPAEGEAVWAGTGKGLALVDKEQGVVETYGRQAGLDDLAINGLARHDGILYVSTLSGLYRLDLSERAFLPLADADAEVKAPEPSVEVTYPPEDATLHGDVNVTGTAEAPGRPIEKVLVRVDDGTFKQAEGKRDWSHNLDLSGLSPGEHTLQARLISEGDVVAKTQRAIQVSGSAPSAPSLSFDHTPPSSVPPGGVLKVSADVDGDAPVRVQLRARVLDQPWVLTEEPEDGTVRFEITLPSSARGAVTYRFHVQTASGDGMFPDQGRYEIPIGAQPSAKPTLLMGLNPPAKNGDVRVNPGERVNVTGWLQNPLDSTVTLQLDTQGRDAGWLSLSPSQMQLASGQTARFQGTLRVPQSASPGISVVDLVANADANASDATARQSLVVTIISEATRTQNETGTDSDSALPVPGVPPSTLAAGLLAVALLARRHRRDQR